MCFWAHDSFNKRNIKSFDCLLKLFEIEILFEVYKVIYDPM